MFLSIVVPCYNEAKNIRQSLLAIEEFLREQKWTFEIIVVDDGSVDETLSIASEIAKGKKEYRIIANPHKGKGFAVRTGVLAAEGDLILFTDADLAVPIVELKKLIVWVLDQGFDVAIGSREGVGARRINEPYYRHFLGRGFNFGVRFLVLKGIQDTQCGFKLFKKEVAHNVFRQLKVYGDNLTEIDKPYLGAFDVEVLHVAQKMGCKIKEVPVEWHYVPTQRLRPVVDSLKMGFDVLRIWANGSKGPPPPQEVSLPSKGLTFRVGDNLKRARQRVLGLKIKLPRR